MEQHTRPTLTGGQGKVERGRAGIISGYVFRVIREQLGLTQDGFAESFGVSADTIAGWESGRRPLTSVPVGQMLVHRHRLMHMGVGPELLAALERATEADVLLASALDDGASTDTGPLGAWVMQRDLVEVLIWPLNGVAPALIRALPSPRRVRRGPVEGSGHPRRGPRSLLRPHARDRRTGTGEQQLSVAPPGLVPGGIRR